jgi:hypothetical protein
LANKVRKLRIVGGRQFFIVSLTDIEYQSLITNSGS